MTDTAAQTKTPPSYLALEDAFADMGHLSRVIDLLDWDRAVMMPKGGGVARAEQYSLLSSLRHQQMCSDNIRDLIAETENKENDLTAWQNANFQDIKRLHLRATAIPRDLQQALSRSTSTCENQWEISKPENDFATVAPLLEDVLSLTRQSATAVAEACSLDDPYDAMLDVYDKSGNRYHDIQPLFSALEDWLPDAVDQAIATQKTPLDIGEDFPLEKQEALSRYIVDIMGYEGRLDTSSHPFSSGRLGDVRITTRYSSNNFIVDACQSVMHEAGHGIYDMQVPKDWQTQPVGGAFDISMAIHESQAMVMERQIGQSRAFWNFIAPKCREIFGIEDSTPAWQAENLYCIVNQVRKSLIRVEADEMTYPLHILLRTKLEKAMIDGDLTVKDLPTAWHDGMKDILGIVPENDTTGCLQDPHWYGGSFGYFPSYLLGAMNASQIYQAMCRDITKTPQHIEKGDFSQVRKWLKDNIHGYGCYYTPRELIRTATGDYLQLETHKNHLTQRYLQA